MQQQPVVAVRLSASKMDFQFTLYCGQAIAKCSMEHQGVANWLNTEVLTNPHLVQTALQQIQQIKPQQEIQLVGKEYSLFINADEIMVRANNLDFGGDDDLEDDFHYYNEESIAFCGTEDFVHFLQSYLDFIRDPK